MLTAVAAFCHTPNTALSRCIICAYETLTALFHFRTTMNAQRVPDRAALAQPSRLSVANQMPSGNAICSAVDATVKSTLAALATN